MQAIKMSIYALKDVTEKEQLAFVHKMYTYPNDNGGKVKLGVFEKFSNSLGYKPLDWHYLEGWSIKEKTVESPEDYQTPYDLMCDTISFFNEKNELASFIVEVGEMVHTDSKYSYNTLDMMLKFQEFLYKVYKGVIRIEFKLIKSAKLSVKDWLLSHFYSTVAMGEEYDTECALPRLLTKREKKSILDTISKYVSYKADINQFHCETCASYDSTRPYHTELVDVAHEKRMEQEAVKEGWFKYYLQECG